VADQVFFAKHFGFDHYVRHKLAAVGSGGGLAVFAVFAFVASGQSAVFSYCKRRSKGSDEFSE
jgi:hypothetical protein